MSKIRRRLGLWIASGLVLLLVSAAAGGYLVRSRSWHRELEQARQALTAGRSGVARERLIRLAEHWTNQGELYLLLGECELARGRREDALTAWSKVPPASPFFGQAAVLRSTHLINSGRYAPAEAILLEAFENPGPTGRFDLERVLGRLYRFEGRFDDLRRLLRESWCRSPDPAGLLKELWALDHSPMPVESWQLALSKADNEDDRVWLGRANHDILTGQFTLAADWLDRCLKRRPDDPAVWQARLELAVAADDVPGFWTAVDRLPANRFDPSAVDALRVWLAARSGDDDRERRALRDLLRGAPGIAKALERLAVLTIQAGQHAEVDLLHRRKAEIDRNQDQFRKILFDGDDLASRAGLLAKITNALGRTFDARAWGILAEAKLQGQASKSQTPLSGPLLARAEALSNSYKLATASGSSAGAMLGERLAELRASPASAHAANALGRKSPNRTDPPGVTPDFTDDAEASGLRFVFDNGRTLQEVLPETMSGGVGLIDFDGDGWLDVYCVQGGPIFAQADDSEKKPPVPGDRLFRNRRDGTFEDVTQAAGIVAIAWGRGYGLGVTVADYDNDRHPDLFVSRLTSYALYRNQGDGTFEDVTAKAGLAGRRDNPTSAAFADLDNDGDLDLYVCHYMVWDPANPPLCKNDTGGYFYCDPSRVEPAPDHLFRNDGGHFVDVTATAGCAETSGRGLGVVAADIDDDNRVDLYVANDGTANYLFHNLGNFQFAEIGLAAGAAGSAAGGYQAGMGVACGDLDGDGRPDLLVTNFYGEGTTLYQNLGQALFADRSAASGIGLATRYVLGFGIAISDVNNDGRPDVMITNGHVNDHRTYYPYAMPCQLFQNQPDGRFVDISRQAGPCWQVARVGRGLAAGDLDNDGRVDALILAQNEPLAYFHNRTEKPGRFITFSLEGTRSNRDGIGARVTITAGGRRQVASRLGGGSYQSAGDSRLHFGLGNSEVVDSVEVRWQSGKIDRWTNLAAGKWYLLPEGAQVPRSMQVRSSK
jgi:enediyne biosynthesis protein E4